ncbi:MAG: hypothetical protein ACTHW7_09315 [Actinomycetaceae bacterium]
MRFTTSQDKLAAAFALMAAISLSGYTIGVADGAGPADVDQGPPAAEESPAPPATE